MKETYLVFPEDYKFKQSMEFSYLIPRPMPEIWLPRKNKYLAMILNTPTEIKLNDDETGLKISIMGDLDEEIVIDWVNKKLNLDRYNLMMDTWKAFDELGISHFVKSAKGFVPTKIASPHNLLYTGAVKTVLLQMLSVPVAFAMTARLVEFFGRKITINDSMFYSFPEPELLFLTDVEKIKSSVKTSTAKANTIKSLASLGIKGELKRWEEMPTEKIVEKLKSVKGIGNWSARVTVMAGLGRFEAQPLETLAMAIKKVSNGDVDISILKKYKHVAGLMSVVLLYANELKIGRYYKKYN